MPIPIRMEHDFRLDLDELASLVTPRTRMLVINSPANPTGGVLTRADLEAIAELAIRHDLVVLADEIYGRILYDGEEHVSIASLPGMAERTIVLDGFSQDLRDDRLAARLRDRAAVARRDVRPAHDQHDQLRADVRPDRRGRGAPRAAGADGGDGRGVPGPARPHRRRPERDPRDPLPLAAGRVLRLPGHLRDGPDRQASWPTGCSRRPASASSPGTAFGGIATDHIRISYANSRENLTEGARADPRRSSRRCRPEAAIAGSAPMSVARDRPAEGLRRAASSPTTGSRPIIAALRRPGLAGRPAAAARRRSSTAVRGCDGVLTLLTDRVDDEFLDAAGPQLKVVSQLRRRLRQHRRPGLHARAASRSATRRAS